MDSREAFIALNLIEGVGPVRARSLLEHFGDAPKILAASKHELTRVRNIGDDTAEKIHDWEKSIDLAGELKRITDYGCHVLIQSDENYPASLREIYDPPLCLYVKGELTAKDKNCVALVGSRMTTHYGIETARKLAYQLAYTGVTVVSGGARGIDTAAHQGALSGKGRTIAVLGTGINLVFPTENAELFDRIASNGAVITQFPFNRPADKQSFPIRNRIVAGMTLGTVVVEANLSSGALITANFATEYGRQIFAVPGRINQFVSNEMVNSLCFQWFWGFQTERHPNRRRRTARRKARPLSCQSGTMTLERFKGLGRAFHPSSVFDRIDWLNAVNGQRFGAGTQWRCGFVSVIIGPCP